MVYTKTTLHDQMKYAYSVYNNTECQLIQGLI